MELVVAEKLAKSLMLKHGLEEWSFAWDNSKKRFGVCKYRRLNSGYAPTGTIGLSRLLVEVNDVIQVTDTILHEIAHALTLGDGHGYAWKRKCIEIGAKPERCYTNKDTVSPTMRYQAICGGCNAVYQKTRQPKSYLKQSCRCQKGIDWGLRHLLTFNDSQLE